MKRGKVSPASLVLGLALTAMLVTFARNNGMLGGKAAEEEADCPYDNPRLCYVLSEEARARGTDEPEIILPAEEVCRSSGYLCVELEDEPVVKILRWPDETKRLVVRIPLPDFEPRETAIALQRAAARGIEAWQGHPFGLTIQTGSGGGRPADILVVWHQTLEGRQLGLARTRWKWMAGEAHFEVEGLDLATRSPRNPRRLLTERQVSLVSAHEMGHALGLPHSDSPADLMYPTNTANRLSTRDYRTMEAIYALPNGAEIHPDR